VPRLGPVPFLVARTDLPAHDTPGRCLSCSDAIVPPQRYRCGLCVAAVERLLTEVREGDSQREAPGLEWIDT
jgi:hypothetical protein